MNEKESALVFSKSLSLIEKTRRHVEQIDAATFPTTSSEKARNLLLSALDALAKPSHWPSMSPEALYKTLIHIQGLIEEVELSTSNRISWPLVSYCDHIWKNLFGKSGEEIFYSLTTLHTYSISSFTNNLTNPLYNVLPSEEVSKIAGQNKLYCLQLASLEDENLPLYANIGHEFGHALWASERDALAGLLGEECNGIVQEVFGELKARDASQAAKRTERAIGIIRAFATELFCDLMGAHIAGPAFFLSLLEMSWGSNANIWRGKLVPKDEEIRAYPSFRFRLGAVGKWVGMAEFGKAVRHVVGDLFDDPLGEFSAYLSEMEFDHASDRLRVASDPDSDGDRRVLEEVLAASMTRWKASLSRFVDRCKTEFLPARPEYTPFIEVSEDDVSALLQRLYRDIVPNIIPDGTLLGRPASFATILNASAFYRWHLLLKGDMRRPAADVFQQHQKLERLTAKALEVSYIQKRFNQWKEEGGDRWVS